MTLETVVDRMTSSSSHVYRGSALWVLLVVSAASVSDVSLAVGTGTKTETLTNNTRYHSP